MLPSIMVGLMLVAAGPDHISILPLGTISPRVIRVLRRELGTRFHIAVQVLPAETTPEYAFRWVRGQYCSPVILDTLARRLAGLRGQSGEKGNGRLLAVSDVDLYAEDLDFVFGQADLVDRVAVVSLTRLREEFYHRPASQSRFLSRAVREAVHELGHTYALTHCPDPHCVMFFSNRLADTDRKSSDFCARCRAKLPAPRRR